MSESATTILVADDDEGYLYPIVNLFEDSGFKVLQASDKSSIEKNCGGAQIWIIDVRLPTGQMEGIQAVRERLQAGAKPRHVFFISVSPRLNANEALKAISATAVPFEWLEKPFELELLLQKVQMALAIEGVRS